MSIDPEASDVAQRFEPILLFHPDENFFPIDPKFYLERCALWRSEPPSHDKNNWGELPHTTFPRKPQLAKGTLAALEDERDVSPGGKTWIGFTDSNGKSPFLVVPEQETERPLSEDRFLQLTGWEPFVSPPDEVTATSNNRHPTLGANFYNGALQGGHPWYYAEYLSNQQLIAQFKDTKPNGLNLSKAVIDNPKLSLPKLLIYHFFYALHEEPLRGCEEAGEGQTFATFAGEWTSVAILLNSANEPLHIGLTSRNVGAPTSIPTLEDRIGMIVRPWKDVNRVGEHPKIFVSRGTHSNYLKTGPHALKPFTPGDIDLNQGTCAQIETLDDVIPGGEGTPATEGTDADWVLIFIKMFGTLGAHMEWAEEEGAFAKFGTLAVPAIDPNRQPQDDTGGPLFGLILRPAGLFVPEQAAAQRTENWQTKMPEPTDKPRYDFIVDRDKQLWWPPRGASRGYAGRWGPRVTNDPKRRRSGMRCPPFALLFLEGIAKL
jgi:hypothetical protein